MQPRHARWIPCTDRARSGRWELWLNVARPEQAVVARWVYEQWTIARLYFDPGASGRFFRMVHSTILPDRAVGESATCIPDSDPGGPFSYCSRPYRGTRVYKLHYEPKKDTLSIVAGIAIPYPNFMLDVFANASDQLATLLSGQALGELKRILRRPVEAWGVRRTSPKF